MSGNPPTTPSTPLSAPLFAPGVFIASERTIYVPMPTRLRAELDDTLIAAWDPSRSVVVNFLNILYRGSAPEKSQASIGAFDISRNRTWIGELGDELNALSNPTTEEEIHASSTPLKALRQYVAKLFDFGPRLASQFYARIENAVREETTIVDRLEIPLGVPTEFFADSFPWDSQQLAASLILVVAAPEEWMYDALRFQTKAMGGHSRKLKDIKETPSASLRDAFEAAKKGAMERAKTTVLCVELVDLTNATIVEMELPIAENFCSFSQTFIMGIGPDGVMILQAGGTLGGYTLEEYGFAGDDRFRTGDEGNRFVTAFEKFAVRQGKWNHESYKAYQRCFGIDLKEFHKVEEAWPKDYFSWVFMYKIEDVMVEDIRKFMWL